MKHAAVGGELDPLPGGDAKMMLAIGAHVERALQLILVQVLMAGGTFMLFFHEQPFVAVLDEMCNQPAPLRVLSPEPGADFSHQTHFLASFRMSASRPVPN